MKTPSAPTIDASPLTQHGHNICTSLSTRRDSSQLLIHMYIKGIDQEFFFLFICTNRKGHVQYKFSYHRSSSSYDKHVATYINKPMSNKQCLSCIQISKPPLPHGGKALKALHSHTLQLQKTRVKDQNQSISAKSCHL